jgi:glycosyltransferase involved in cell wall biosynthesis
LTVELEVIKACIIIPAYNEENTIRQVINGLPDDVDIIVVDDGSTDSTADQVRQTRAKLIRHEQNLGYCAAIRSALKHCQSEIIITLDADGQHKCSDVTRLLDVMNTTKADLVLGSRFKGIKRKNIYDVIVERIFSLLIYLTCGRWLSDCSCGLKAFRRSLAALMPPVHNRAGFHQLICMVALRHRLRVIEIPITVTARKYGVSKVRKPSKIFLFIVQVVVQMLTYRGKKAVGSIMD